MISTLTPQQRIDRLNILREKKLVTARTVGNKTIYKYSRSVFWDNLWHTDPLLLEARGLVLDDKGEILVRPFTKIFNYMENNSTFPRDETVSYVEKKNGFMGVVSVIKEAGKIVALVSTSGSLESDFVELAKKHLTQRFLDGVAIERYLGMTFLFEICSPEDPHIIEEEYDVYLIGARYVNNEMSLTETELDEIVDLWMVSLNIADFQRPHFGIGRFSDVVKHAAMVKHEGYMVYNQDRSKALKIKSPHYLGKKFLSRSKRTELIWTQPAKAKEILDEEFYELIELLPTKLTLAEWKAMEQIARLRFVEALLTPDKEIT